MAQQFLQTSWKSNALEIALSNKSKRSNIDRNPDFKRILKTIHAKRNHEKIRTAQFEPHYLSTARVLRSYTDSGNMDKALHLFENIRIPDTFLWNIMIRGYADNGLYKDAIDFYHQMQFVGVSPDYFTFPFVIKSCTALFSFAEGWKIHCKLIKIGLDSDIFICNSLIAMYAKLGHIEFAEKVFTEMPIRDLVSWNSMLGGYVSDGDGWKALSCFQKMQALSLKTDRFSIISAAAACSLEKYPKLGKEIHCNVIRFGVESDIMVQTSLVDMYCKCGEVDLSKKVFNMMNERNVVTWNALIGGYVLNGLPLEAFACFLKMQEADKTNPDTVTMVNLLPACAQVKDLSQGRSIHGYAIRKGFFPFVVLETVLIDMYAKCGRLRSAVQLFEKMIEKNLVSWNSMIAAYVQNGMDMEAMELFRDLQKGPLKPDSVTIASILPAFAELRSLRQGKQIHCYVTKNGYGLNTMISNSIIYMYAKCGSLQDARTVFDGMLLKDVVSWNVIIMGYGIHGCGRIALELFSTMQEKGIEPNGSTFVSVLSSCSVAGLVDEGWKYFDSMQRDYGIDPQIEHYGCMVDLLGRTGSLDLAQNFIKRIQLVPTARIWGSLLAASRNNRNVELAEFAAERVFALEHDNTGCYVLLSNMYAEAKRWEDAERVRSLMKKEGLEKTKGSSVVELNSKTYSFVNGDRSHVETNMIYDVLAVLSKQIGEAICIPSTKFRLIDSMNEKEILPSSHSVRLALCFGLISTTVGSPILVKKNVRICNDCHHAVKLISKVTRREIIVGDSSLYHHFKDGLCCCGDYW